MSGGGNPKRPTDPGTATAATPTSAAAGSPTPPQPVAQPDPQTAANLIRQGSKPDQTGRRRSNRKATKAPQDRDQHDPSHAQARQPERRQARQGRSASSKPKRLTMPGVAWRARSGKSLKHRKRSFRRNIHRDVRSGGRFALRQLEPTIKTIYERAWLLPEGVADDDAMTVASVTIARDGTVVSHRQSAFNDPVVDRVSASRTGPGRTASPFPVPQGI